MIYEQKITVEASSVEEALADISKRWQIPSEKLQAQIVSEERKGFLGLGGKTFKIEITVPTTETKTENSPAAVEKKIKADAAEDSIEAKQSAKQTLATKLLAHGADFVNETLKLMEFKAEAVVSEDAKNTLNIQGEDASDYVVGRYGDALRSMGYLVNLSLRDPKFEPRIKVDSCGYRDRRTKSLERLAEATARQATKYGRPVRLEPMASWERWVIHTTLKDRDDITTESVGEAPFRKVVIMPKYDPNRDGEAGPATMRIRARRERVVSQPIRRPSNEGRRRRPRRSDRDK